MSHRNETEVARRTASTSRALAPPGTLTLIIPITISMQAGRRSWVALFTCADFTDTTGTKVGITRTSAGRPESIRGQASLYSILLPRHRHCGCIPQSLRGRVLDPRTREAQAADSATSSDT